VLAACLAFRNAAPYLREWLLFHAAVGVQRFYLYNNDSTDDFERVLTPFLRAGGPIQMEPIAWPGYCQQNAIYEDCLKRATAAGDVRWLAFIDDDEFLYATSGQPLPELLRDFEPFASVAACWQLYGSSGHIHASDDWVIRRFTRRAAGPDQHVKCIVQPARILRPIAGGHLFEPKPGFVSVDEHRRPLNDSLTPTPSTDLLRINHYLIKSIEEMIARRTSRDIGYGDKAKLPLLEWIRLDRAWNATEDASARGIEPRMRQLEAEFPAQ
jgi:hypothetical protein